MTRKGIILAGGTGSRLYPATIGISKQLLPIYDKPMIYYPLTTLMLAGIRDIAIITTPQDQAQFQSVLGDGSQWGCDFTYLVQPSPDGLAQAYMIAEAFLAGAPSAMILGDNMFFGHSLTEKLKAANADAVGGVVFGYQVQDPGQYGVVEIDNNKRVLSIEEKPANPRSNLAITGLYFLDGTAPTRAKRVTPSARGELEITDLLQHYADDGLLVVEQLGRGYAWLDTGTHSSLLDAGNFVRTLENRQGVQMGCPEEIAFNAGWINTVTLQERLKKLGDNAYSQYLRELLN
jgi:glucose-1-phosphate thymidylyltransferase